MWRVEGAFYYYAETPTYPTIVICPISANALLAAVSGISVCSFDLAVDSYQNKLFFCSIINRLRTELLMEKSYIRYMYQSIYLSVCLSAYPPIHIYIYIPLFSIFVYRPIFIYSFIYTCIYIHTYVHTAYIHAGKGSTTFGT